VSADFGRRLDAAMTARGPLCVGIDPHAQLLESWELPSSVDGLRRFADACVKAFADTVAVIKPQSAFFEAYGSPGIAVLEDVVRRCRAGGALVVLDVKRGDIGSTMAAYAQAYLGPDAPVAADAITVSPYLGVGALDPAFDLAAQHGAGLFVLALTSNKEGQQVQHARSADGRWVGQVVVDEVAQRNADARPMGSFGVVVGATVGDVELDVSRLNGPLLVPGIGAQGGTADDVRRLFGAATAQVLPSVSREVLRSGPDVATLRQAALRVSEQFAFLRP
jgi:orotidine-5'-phosphate decarboxylase